MFFLSYLISIIFASFTFIKGNVRSIIVLMIIVTLVLFAGTRIEGVDPDFEVHATNFKYLLSPQLEAIDFIVFEPSYFLVPFIGKLFLGNSLYIQFSFLMFALIGVTTKISAMKDSQYFFLSVALYGCYSFFYQEMITIRAGVASGFFLLAIKDLDSKNDRMYFSKMLLAFLFHYSSIIFILVWIYIRLELTVKTCYYLLLASFLVAFSQINLLMLLRIDLLIPKVKIYFDIMELEGKVKINLFNYRILISFFMLFLFSYTYKLLEKQRYFVTLLKIHIFSLILFFLLSTAAIVFSDRTYDLLSIVQVLLYPFVILVFKERIVGYLIVFSICAINLFFILKSSGLLLNYSSWLF